MNHVSILFSMIDGVTIFFVLSGFLVGYRLIEVFSERASNSSLSSFFISRWSKTLPGYYVILLLLLLLRPDYINENDIPIEKYLFFIQNFNENHPLFFEEAWSLSVEEWFYLLVPLLLAILIKIFKCSVKASFLIICIVVICMSHIGRFSISQDVDSVNFFEFVRAIRGRVISRMDAPVFGAIVAYYYYYFPKYFEENRFKMLKIWGVFVAILLMTNIYVFTTIDLMSGVVHEQRVLWVSFGLFYFDIAQACAALCIPFLFFVRVKWRFAKDIVTYVSKVSYSIYLTHSGLVIGVFLPFIGNYIFGDIYFGDHKLLLLFAYITLVMVSSLLLYYLVEMPFHRMKTRWISKINKT